jgi:hypothetical protein
MIDPGELGWVPENEQLLLSLLEDLSKSAFQAMECLIDGKEDLMHRQTETLYVSAVLIARLDKDNLIFGAIDRAIGWIVDSRTNYTAEQLKPLAETIFSRTFEQYNAQIKEGKIPEAFKSIKCFDFSKKKNDSPARNVINLDTW